MPDAIDKTTEREAHIESMQVDVIRSQVAEMPKGVAGECELCGECSSRLVRGVCAPCRDKHGLP